MSSQIDTQILHWSLWLAGPRKIEKPSSIITVSLNENDFRQLSQLHIRDHQETSINNYYYLIDQLLKLGAKTIFVHWQADAFPKETNYNLFLNLHYKAKQMGKNIYWAIHPPLIKNLPTDFRQEAFILEADPCESYIQIMCVFDNKWTNWIMQIIPTLYWQEAKQDENNFFPVLSTNLAPESPAYLLHYNSINDFQDFSFESIIHPTKSTARHVADKIVFVGNDLIQGQDGMTKTVDIGRVKTVSTPYNSPTRRTGIPLHKFWAQHAQMFIDNALIGIAPFETSLTLAMLLASLILFLLYSYGAMNSLSSILFFACTVPFLNILAIRFFNIYLPIFDCLFAGLSAFVLGTFAKLSLESFHQWRLRISQKSELELLAAKDNFISLLSHNLNTPIAKMHGILSAIEGSCQKEPLRNDVIEAQRLVTTIQMVVRSVLVTTSLEEHALNNEVLTLESLEQIFRESILKPLSRIGIEVDIVLLDDELVGLPFRFDKRALSVGLSSLLISLAHKDRKNQFQVHFSIEQGGDDKILLITTVSNSDPFCSEKAQSLLEEVANGVLTSLLKAYNGKISRNPTNVRIELQPS